MVDLDLQMVFGFKTKVEESHFLLLKTAMREMKNLMI